jgi:hypothetical protein
MDLPQWIIAVATILLAFATVLLAAVAAFQKIIENWIFKPNLKVMSRACEPYCHKNLLTITDQRTGAVIDSVDGYYLRIEVTNSGRGRANQVEVFAKKLEKKQADGSYRERSEFDPMNLSWSHWETPIIDGISREMPKYCGLAHIYDPAKRQRFPTHLRKNAPCGQALLEFCLQRLPNTGTHVVESGLYRLHILVAAANARPKPFVVEINFSGQYFADESKMMSEGFGIMVL